MVCGRIAFVGVLLGCVATLSQGGRPGRGSSSIDLVTRHLQEAAVCESAWCPSTYQADDVCDAQCKSHGCPEDKACSTSPDTCPSGKFHDPAIHPCQDSPEVKAHGKNCKLLIWAAKTKKHDCAIRLATLAELWHRPLPEGVADCTRLMDACPSSCVMCNTTVSALAHRRGPLDGVDLSGLVPDEAMQALEDD
ncbi:unnamed protein product [Vitrella brassicaformis CCMP3155]|uniref:ShKT domain-containing protein n=1 Tax=Vitrella brassicaformis (strain CCMP3155) TaxID=1169540 RepID=A0A0G4EM01_VITBC|nr:unnamed protein product [Vitrella brassicaformis CCMP3155]|eukprot:CEL98157.1 unnamed protein product [Vitrella brassicaformis CCMP3155]